MADERRKYRVEQVTCITIERKGGAKGLLGALESFMNQEGIAPYLVHEGELWESYLFCGTDGARVHQWLIQQKESATQVS